MLDSIADHVDTYNVWQFANGDYGIVYLLCTDERNGTTNIYSSHLNNSIVGPNTIQKANYGPVNIVDGVKASIPATDHDGDTI